VAHLLSKIGELEAEVEALYASITGQEVFLLDGYVVLLSPGVDVPWVAECPTLHAATQGETFDVALANLRDAMEVAVEGRKDSGSPIPPKDTEARCLD
jgi:predicted RNase H-like HicB family nuclease